ncbi:alcohol oxidase [Panus rudis PR-1116 ss-1]|nr:alcohol oxidase [Panus rudis PR-1116 ss-1]
MSSDGISCVLGGTAGCVLASRLSELPGVTVLVIERGRAPEEWTDSVPLISAIHWRKGATAAHWKTPPMKNVRNRVTELITGEGLGGGSLVNSTVYTRGTKGDWDGWKQPGWTYDEILGYYKKAETSSGHKPSSFRGRNGSPWKINTFPRFNFKVVDYLQNAAITLGMPQVDDINAPDAPATALSAADLAIDEGMHRSSTAAAYLPKSLCHARKARLKICTYTLARKLDIETTRSGTLRARGVYIESVHPTQGDKGVYYVRAKNEIILSAGAVSTPQLLLLSGVGPQDYLKSQNIDVVHDLPGVGTSVQDHFSVPVTYQVPMRDSMHGLRVSVWRAVVELVKYLVLGTGIFGVPFIQLGIFYQSSLLDDKGRIDPSKAKSQTDPSENVPDIEIMPIASRCSDDPVDEIDRLGVFTLLTCMVKPKSFGTIRLASKDPRDRALVDLNFLSDPSELVRLRKGIRFDFRLAEEIRRQGYPLKDLRVPASESDEDIDDFILSHLRTTFHFTSSCRMGSLNDARPGVVDHELKVHGIDGLRICDASVFLEILGAHTMAPVVAVAEKCADMIKQSPA